MNKTRINWTSMKCCKDRTSSPVEFLTLSGFSVFISIVFYMATYLIGVRKERIQYIPDDLMPLPGDREQSNGTIMNINAAESSTNQDDEPVNKIINNDFDDSMSSDDDILPTGNANLLEI